MRQELGIHGSLSQILQTIAEFYGKIVPRWPTGAKVKRETGGSRGRATRFR
jgi:hypothetical protein